MKMKDFIEAFKEGTAVPEVRVWIQRLETKKHWTGFCQLDVANGHVETLGYAISGEVAREIQTTGATGLKERMEILKEEILKLARAQGLKPRAEKLNQVEVHLGLAM